MMNDTGLDAIVGELLQPIAADAPGGRWLRYERVYMELARAREEDDPHLPLGEWERPLVKANWKQVAAECARLLREESKDFQIAAWLCDAWVRLYQMDGLRAALALVAGLAERHWDHAWPAIEDGDADRRVAPFVWLNTSLPLTLKLQVSLLTPGPQRAEALKMADWERASTRDEDVQDASAATPILSRQAIRASVKPADGMQLQAVAQQAGEAAATLRALNERLDDKLQKDAPSLARVLAMIEAIEMAGKALLDEIAPPAEPGAPLSTPLPDAAAADAPVARTSLTEGMTAAPAQATPAAAPATTDPTSSDSGFVSREHAYQVLDAAAVYLASIEPHSPAPYMIRRAVELGQLSLPQMLAEVTADAGSLDQFFSLLGIKSAR